MNAIREHKTFFLIESVLFIILGMLAIILPGIFTLSFTLLIGALFVVAGVLQLFRAFSRKTTGGVFVTLISSAFYIFVGVLLYMHPVIAVLSITMLLAILFFAQGIIQIYWALTVKHLARSGWWIFSGLVSILLAALVWYGWPLTAEWFIGMLVGVNLLFAGFTQLFITLEA